MRVPSSHLVVVSFDVPRLGGAWTLPPVQPIAAATTPSFAEIQRVQEMQGTMRPRDKRSLRDIQEEERAHQQEVDFLKWWAAEEERVQLEMTAQEREKRRGDNKGGKGRSRKTRETQAEKNSGTVTHGHRKPRQTQD